MKYPILTKVVIIICLSLIMVVPLSMVQSTIQDRNYFRQIAKNDIQKNWSNNQTIIGPVIIVSYRTKNTYFEGFSKGSAYFSPEILNIQSHPVIDYRKRGIFSFPVYTAVSKLRGAFSTGVLTEFSQKIENFESWQNATITVSITDTRGIVNQPKLKWGGVDKTFVPGSNLKLNMPGIHASIGEIETGKEVNFISFEIDFEIRGTGNLQFAPLGKVTSAKIISDWEHPSFNGRFPPVKHDVSGSGFSAQWKQSLLSTGINDDLISCEKSNCAELINNTFGVSFIEPVDIYRQSLRSVKYGILIIGLVFITFFLLEIVTGIKIHPLQYLFVGASLTIFFLILLSAAEFISFGIAFLMAASSSVGLIGCYVKHIFKSRRAGLNFCFALSVAFLLLYVIIQAENYSLLMGSLVLFMALGSVMMATRKMDWYEVELKSQPIKSSQSVD